jgi:glyoxylase-like metal-dependent hydrolase (beta-lactamase superfamily II)
VQVERLTDGLWRWTARHPDWTPEEGGPEGWDPEVASIYWEASDAVVLIDPLAPPARTPDAERFWTALDRDVEHLGLPVAVLLTIFFHERSAAAVLERYAARPGAAVWACGSAADRVEVDVSHRFAAGDLLPGGITAYDMGRADEVVYWLPGPRALVAGDVLLGTADGGLRVCPDSWFAAKDGPARARAALRRLLDLPIEMVLVAHGPPVLHGGHDALARALSPQVTRGHPATT